MTKLKSFIPEIKIVSNESGPFKLFDELCKFCKNYQADILEKILSLLPLNYKDYEELLNSNVYCVENNREVFLRDRDVHTRKTILRISINMKNGDYHEIKVHNRLIYVNIDEN